MVNTFGLAYIIKNTINDIGNNRLVFKVVRVPVDASRL